MPNHSETTPRMIAIACQGGGSHAAFAAGALKTLLANLDRESSELVGISGTSGGALCALAAWYGLLTGGIKRANDLLDGLWGDVATQTAWEDWTNMMAVNATEAVGLLGCEVDWNPYRLPLWGLERLNTQLWPAATEWFPPLKALWRRDYFRFEALVKHQVDEAGFELIGELGRFWSILRLAERRKVASLDANLGDDVLFREDPRKLSYEIGKRFTSLASLQRAAHTEVKRKGRQGANGNRAPEGLLANALEKAQRHLPKNINARELNDDEIEACVCYVREVTRRLPKLLLGAVDLEEGSFVAFSSSKAPDEYGITRDAVLASAALPYLFEAVKVGVSDHLDPEALGWHKPKDPRTEPYYWDGLLSQNPPIHNFTSDLADEGRKPQEILVIQVNPADFPHAGARVADRIWDRRNQLAGNLSLNQELSFIDAINRRLLHEEADSPKVGEQTRRREGHWIQTLRLTLDLKPLEDDLGHQLGAVSKLDRDNRLIDDLLRHGGQQAEAFLAVRDFFQHALWADASSASKLPKLLDNTMRQLSAAFKFPSMLSVDELTFNRPESKKGSWEVIAKWHTHAVKRTDTDVSVRLRGTANFTVTGRIIEDGSFTDIRITRMWRRETSPTVGKGKPQPREDETLPTAPAGERPTPSDGEGQRPEV